VPRRPGEALQGEFATRGLPAGVYTLQATIKTAQGAEHTARREVILAPDPFNWQERR
jgi:hypothetical protein